MASFEGTFLVEGVLERDPSTGRFVIRGEGGEVFDPVAAMEKLAGQEVRFTLASFTDLERLQAMYEALPQP